MTDPYNSNFHWSDMSNADISDPGHGHSPAAWIAVIMMMVGFAFANDDHAILRRDGPGFVVAEVRDRDHADLALPW